MTKNVSTNNFTSGELSPFLDARSDLSKYENGCITLENFRPLPWGGATYRPGTLFCGFAKYNDRPHRLLPFNYSTTLSFVLELGDHYMRFWNRDGTPVLCTMTNTDAWVSGANYFVGNLVNNGASRYFQCIVEILGGTTTPLSDPTHWLEVTSFEVYSDFAQAEIFEVQYKQINSQMRLVHKNQLPATLTFQIITGTWPFSATVTKWTLVHTVFRYPPFRDQNVNQAVKLNVSALTGTVNLISNTSGFFNALHSRAFFELQHLRASASITQPLNVGSTGWNYSSNIAIEGAWTFSTSQFWDGEVVIQRSVDAGVSWTTIRDFTGKCDQNYSTSGDENEPAIGQPVILYRIGFNERQPPFTTVGGAPNWVGSAPSQYAPAQGVLESQDAYISGVVQITSITNTQTAVATIILAPQSTSGTYLWAEGAFSDYRGFPSSIAFYEQRLIYSGTKAQPNTVWGSVTGDFDNFKYSDLATGAFAFQPAVCEQNMVAWIASLLRIHVATSGEEIVVYSGNLDDALTPSNVIIRRQSAYGSALIQPLILQNSILFVERTGRRVREMREMSTYVAQTDFVAPDLTLLAEHITQSGIIQMDFGRIPDPLNYFVRNDGVMAVMTYNREQNINAWARYTTNGKYESVASIYGTPNDEVFVSVQRTISGVTRRCIEAFTTDPATEPNLETNLLLDCGVQKLAGVDFTSGDTQIDNLNYLANMTVTAVVDGAHYPNLTVSALGRLLLPSGVQAFRVVNVGLPYAGLLTPMRAEVPEQEGSSQGKRRRVSSVVLRVRNSVSVEFSGGKNPTAWQLMQSRRPDDTTGSATPLGGGASNPNGIEDWPLPGPWPDGNTFSAELNFRQSKPFPLTLIGIFHELEVF